MSASEDEGEYLDVGDSEEQAADGAEQEQEAAPTGEEGEQMGAASPAASGVDQQGSQRGSEQQSLSPEAAEQADAEEPAAAAAAEAHEPPKLGYKGPKVLFWEQGKGISGFQGLKPMLMRLLGLGGQPPLTAGQVLTLTKASLAFQHRRVAQPGGRMHANLGLLLGRGKKHPLAPLGPNRHMCAHHGAGGHTTSECNELPSFDAAGHLSVEEYFAMYSPKLLAHPASTNRPRVGTVRLFTEQEDETATHGAAQRGGPGRNRGGHSRGHGRHGWIEQQQDWGQESGAQQYGAYAPAAQAAGWGQRGHWGGYEAPSYGEGYSMGYGAAAVAAGYAAPEPWEQQQGYPAPGYDGAGLAMQPWEPAATAAAAAGLGHEGYGFPAASAAAGAYGSSALQPPLMSASARAAQQQEAAAQEQQRAQQTGAAASGAVQPEGGSVETQLTLQLQRQALEAVAAMAMKAGRNLERADGQVRTWKRKFEEERQDGLQKCRRLTELQQTEQQLYDLRRETEDYRYQRDNFEGRGL
jgi:hypothetical protein